MKSLTVRWTLTAVVIAVFSVAAYFVWTSESQAQRSVDDARAFDQTAVDIERTVRDLGAAQQAYVAAGQGVDFWIAKVSASTAAVKRQLDSLRSLATAPAGQSPFDNASSALQDFEQLDRRARDYVRNGQKLLASDLIFADGLEIIGAITVSIDQARTEEFAAVDSIVRSTRRAEALAVAGAVTIALVAMLMLLPTQTPTAESAGREVSAAPIMLSIDPAERSQPIDSAPAVPVAFENQPSSPAAVDLDSIASLCSDLAKVVDTHALSALLGRAATVLGAPGIVLWIADPDGRELTPIVTHGYSPQIVVRLGTILRDAENATAAALRTSLLQTVATDAVSNGAIAAPLVTPGGCVGIMAAEVQQHGEKDPSKLAAATIIAAQLATLVGPPSTRAQARADAS
jgi:hypothetical protein